MCVPGLSKRQGHSGIFLDFREGECNEPPLMTFMNGTGRTNGFLVPARSATWAYSGTFCNTRLLAPSLAYRNNPETTRELDRRARTKTLQDWGGGKGKSLVEKKMHEKKIISYNDKGVGPRE